MAMYAAIICVTGFISIPLGPIPIVLQNIVAISAGLVSIRLAYIRRILAGQDCDRYLCNVNHHHDYKQPHYSRTPHYLGSISVLWVNESAV